MNIFISANSQQKFFVRNIQKVAKEKRFGGRHEAIFIPFEISSPEAPTLLEEIYGKMVESNLLLMDVTPRKMCARAQQTYWITNSGVLVEYGMLKGLRYLHRLLLFCEDTINLDNLYPLFHKKVKTYSVDNHVAFRKMVREIIKKQEKAIDSRDTYQERMVGALMDIVRHSSLSPSR